MSELGWQDRSGLNRAIADLVNLLEEQEQTGAGTLVLRSCFPESGPLRMGIPVVDMAAGSNLLVGVLLALYERDRSGRGQHIDLSLYDAGISITHPHAPNYLMTGKGPTLMGNDYANLAPYSLYRTGTQPLFIAVGNDQQFERLCTVIGRTETSRDPRFATNPDRLENREALRSIVEAEFSAEEISALRRDRVIGGARVRGKTGAGI